MGSHLTMFTIGGIFVLLLLGFIGMAGLSIYLGWKLLKG